MPFQTGPAPASSWTVHADRVSLARAPVPPRLVRIAAQPAAIEFDLARTALLVIDMQNDFCHAEGWFGGRGIDVEPMRRPIAAIAPLAAALRDAGSRIVWLNWGLRADLANLPAGVLYRGKRNERESGYGEESPGGHGPTLVRDSWGAALVDELKPAASDLIVHKHRLSGFWDSDLDSILRQGGVHTVLFAGINTDRCVFSTLQDAGFLGYDCVLLEDACGTPSPPYVSDAVLFLVRQLHGFTANAADLIASIQES